MARRTNKISSVRTFLSKLEKLSTDDEYVYYFRGHSNRGYRPIPSIYRDSGWIENEDVLFQELILKCPNDFPSAESTFQKLVKMQHYSLPTRLLDITSNPLAALYFACAEGEPSSETGEVVVFRFRKTAVRYFDSDKVSVLANLSRRPSSFVTPRTTALSSFNEDTSMQLLLHEIRKEKPYFEAKVRPEDLRSVVCVKPKLDNPRIMRQDGAFLIFGMGTAKTDCAVLDPENTLNSDDERIFVSSSGKRKILEQLLRLGISESTLFPEIDNVSAHIKKIYSAGVPSSQAVYSRS